MTKLGYQIPNFTYPGVGPDGLFEAVARQAEAAERSGFDTVLVMDHFYQLPLLGPPDNYMLECYTLLAALAQRTSSVRLSALVTGNTYRNPALLAKTITALDIVSGGRAQLGIGAGWFELEHDSLGFEFGTFTDRFEKLEEALQIIIPMLKGERPTFEGKYYTAKDAINEPQPIRPIPIMIGGSGEKKTLRTVAKYADMWNAMGSLEKLRHKVDVLRDHCGAVGRDISEIEFTLGIKATIRDTEAEADRVWKAAMEHNRTPLSNVESDDTFWNGTAEQLAERLAPYVELGFRTVISEQPAPYDVETFERLIGEVKPLVERG